MISRELFLQERAYQNQWTNVMRILNRKKQLEQERLLRAAAKAKAAAAAAAPAADGAASGSADGSSAAAAAAPAAQEAPSPFAAPPGQLELPAEFIEVFSCFLSSPRSPVFVSHVLRPLDSSRFVCSITLRSGQINTLPLAFVFDLEGLGTISVNFINKLAIFSIYSMPIPIWTRTSSPQASRTCRGRRSRISRQSFPQCRRTTRSHSTACS